MLQPRLPAARVRCSVRRQTKVIYSIPINNIPDWTAWDSETAASEMKRTPTSRLCVPRHIEAQLRTALDQVPLVVLQGPRHSGKTTLARRIAEEQGRVYLSLENEAHAKLAEQDPAGFLRNHPSAVLDAIQRRPALFHELVTTLVRNPDPGRYLITSSVDLSRSASLPQGLTEVMKTVTLLPFSQAEIDLESAPRFLARAFAADFPHFEISGATTDLVERVVSGSYPEALSSTSSAERQKWLRGYARTLAERQIPDFATVGKRYKLVELIEHAAGASGQLLNLSDHATRLGVDSKTVGRWLHLLECLFVIRQIPAFSCDGLNRLIRSPKLHFLDSGLLTALRRVDATSIASDRRTIDALLGCLVYAEIAKAIGQSGIDTDMCHYRDKDQVEISLVLQRRHGELVGIDVKAGATVKPGDFKGLARLKGLTGKRFACGILLYDGEWIQEMDERLFSMPVKMLWEA